MSTEVHGKNAFQNRGKHHSASNTNTTSAATSNGSTAKPARSMSLTTRDKLLDMAREEYARQLCKFTESQMKKQQRMTTSPSMTGMDRKSSIMSFDRS
ncbi:hypothetical protein BDB00DRAFT_853414 [Zychaea mexicana]|uniref:uncharacterized protein n=1 Tax=Zychaea mexicana TaxID=64656 RepID=UPI0022FE986F|nr:uncharacterized protein BDB00DRAFT_853414 [Zychaea mexicana]KAI9484816.1 hypothetical protein BDB00DRAFT_853414 [Zychaea mexicana]